MGDRVVDCARLESVCAEGHRGFESPPIRTTLESLRFSYQLKVKVKVSIEKFLENRFLKARFSYTKRIFKLGHSIVFHGQRQRMKSVGFSRVFVTLLHEATMAAELVCAAVTTLREASTPRSGLYEVALFNLSIGFERMCKLIILVDQCASPFIILMKNESPTPESLRS
jgi:hypothetical protein